MRSSRNLKCNSEKLHAPLTAPSESRRFNMSRIRSKNTKAEVILRKAMWQKNLRFRIHASNLPGKPDIIIKKYKLAIFVDGAFWHGYKWAENKKRIKSNTGFWIEKIESNMRRDREINVKLDENGMTVMRFWDHEIFKSLPRCINQILLYIESSKLGQIPEPT